MKTLLIIDENGQYKNNKNERCELLCCEWVKGERASEFKEFDTLEQAKEYYGLTEVEK